MHYDEDWVDARTRDLLYDLEHSYGRRFDQDGARDMVRAYLAFRGADADPRWSDDDREALASGAAMTLLGKEYRPPSPMSSYGAPVDLAVALNAVVGLAIAAVDWQRHHTEVPDAVELLEILEMFVEWLYPIADTCFDLADAAKSAERPDDENQHVVAEDAGTVVVVVEGDDIDVVVIEARHAFRSAELLAHAAAHLEDDYLSLSDQDAWTNSAAVCAGLSTSVDELRRATGAV